MDDTYDLDAIERHLSSNDLLERLAGGNAVIDAAPAMIRDLRALREDAAVIVPLVHELREENVKLREALEDIKAEAATVECERIAKMAADALLKQGRTG